MSEQLGGSITRIFSPSGAIEGVGCLVSDGHVLTCAHVVAEALGIEATTPEPPTAEVPLDFPLLAPRQMCPARVVGWHPVRADPTGAPDGSEDVAVLELASPPPAGSRPAPLASEDDLWGDPFSAFGFPSGHDDGVWAAGVLRRPITSGWLQIEDVKETGYRVEPGFSGGPVWDERLGQVVGMVVAADKRADVRAAFVIPTPLLIHAWPRLAQQAIPP